VAVRELSKEIGERNRLRAENEELRRELAEAGRKERNHADHDND